MGGHQRPHLFDGGFEGRGDGLSCPGSRAYELRIRVAAMHEGFVPTSGSQPPFVGGMCWSLRSFDTPGVTRPRGTHLRDGGITSPPKRTFLGGQPVISGESGAIFKEAGFSGKV